MSVSLMSVVAAAVEGLESSGKNREYIEAAIYGFEYGVMQKREHFIHCAEPTVDRRPADEAAERGITI